MADHLLTRLRRRTKPIARRVLRARSSLRILLRLKFIRTLDRQGVERYAEARNRLWALDECEDRPLDRSLLSGPVLPAPEDPRRRLAVPPPWPSGPELVCELSNVTLIGRKPTVITEDGGFILDSSTPYRSGDRRVERTMRRIARRHGFRRMRSGFAGEGVPEDRRLGVVSLLADGLQRSYYHWVLEQLTKLRAVDEYRRQTGLTPELVLPPGRYPWMRELIDLAGYADARKSKWRGPDAPARADRIVMPLVPGPTPANCRWLRARLLEATASTSVPATERILIIRGEGRNWWRRAIVNEDELRDALEPLGFRAYELGGMSAADQVRLFARAEIVIGAHGAGLTNMVFSPNAKVLELFGRDVRPHYFRLAHVMGLSYRYLLCEPASVEGLRPKREGSLGAPSKPRPANELPGMRVDLAELKKLLSQIEVEAQGEATDS